MKRMKREILIFSYITLIGFRATMVPFWVILPMIILADGPFGLTSGPFLKFWFPSTTLFYAAYISTAKWLHKKLIQLPKQSPKP